MSENDPNNYQKQFIRLAIKRLPHHAALLIASRTHLKFFLEAFNKYACSHFIGAIDLPMYTLDEQQRYNQSTHATMLWHGTGRFQHSDGHVVDVLDALLKKGALRPVEDAYAIFSDGEIMTSISLTRLRIIARCYADMHGKGYREPPRYGNALMWTSYYYGMFYARMYCLHYGTLRKYWKTWHEHTHDNDGHNTWGKKVNYQAQDVWDAFGLGSDIPTNYPIVIGLKHITDIVPLSPVFQTYEVRVSRTIRLDEITHLEVPTEHIKYTEAALADYNLAVPVLPIELGELIASQKPFSTLLGIG